MVSAHLCSTSSGRRRDCLMPGPARQASAGSSRRWNHGRSQSDEPRSRRPRWRRRRGGGHERRMRPTRSKDHDAERAGRSFAATLLLIVGTLNIVYGIGALDGAHVSLETKAGRHGPQYAGAGSSSSSAPIQLDRRLLAVVGNAFGRVVGIVGAGLGAIGALLAVGSGCPWWSLAIFALCIYILHGIVIFDRDARAIRVIPRTRIERNDPDGHRTTSVRPSAKCCRSPIVPRPGLVTYDAKDPDTSFAPIEPLRPPEGAPNVLIVLHRRRRLRRVERVRRAVRDAERGAPRGGRPEVQPLPHDGAVLADAGGAAERPQPPHGRHGRHHRDRDGRAGLQLDAAEHVRAARRDPASSTATRRRSSASATRCRCGRRARWGRSTTGRPAAASSTSTASSAARPTSTTRRSTRARRRSSPTARPKRATTSWAT